MLPMDFLPFGMECRKRILLSMINSNGLEADISICLLIIESCNPEALVGMEE
jgi:hypothetical protein